jgi:hypothetical protein
MPYAHPRQLGGMQSPVGTIGERLRALEQNRLGYTGSQTGTPLTISSSYAQNTPPGWPSLPVQVGPSGAAMTFAGFTFQFTTNIQANVIVYMKADSSFLPIAGGFLNSTSSGTFSFVFSGTGPVQGLALGAHTFSLGVSVTIHATGGPVTLSSPFLVAFPL